MELWFIADPLSVKWEDSYYFTVSRDWELLSKCYLEPSNSDVSFTPLNLYPIMYLCTACRIRTHNCPHVFIRSLLNLQESDSIEDTNKISLMCRVVVAFGGRWCLWYNHLGEAFSRTLHWSQVSRSCLDSTPIPEPAALLWHPLWWWPLMGLAPLPMCPWWTLKNHNLLYIFFSAPNIHYSQHPVLGRNLFRESIHLPSWVRGYALKMPSEKNFQCADCSNASVLGLVSPRF